LGDDGIHTRVGRALRLCHALYLGKDSHAPRLCRRHVGGGIGKGVVDYRDLLVKGHLDKVINLGEG
jgi:hypothetical protein